MMGGDGGRCKRQNAEKTESTEMTEIGNYRKSEECQFELKYYKSTIFHPSSHLLVFCFLFAIL